MSSVADTLKEKLAAMKQRRSDARTENQKAVVEEDRLAKLPKGHESKKRKIEWEDAEEQKRKAAEAAGEDYDRVKAREMSAMESDRRERKKRVKEAKKDQGFSDFNAMHLRTYTRLVDEIKPDMAAYKKSKKLWGDDAVEADSLAYGKHDHVSKAGLEKMTKALEKQSEKKKAFSRRRAHHHDADIDFINERNRVFNKKLERFYGKVTQEIKDNLERGTAI